MEQKICIYCCGTCGIRTYFELKEHGIKADIFGDILLDKHGYVLDDIYCESYEEVMQESKDILLIIANENPDKIITNFRNAGFLYVLDSKGALEKLVKNRERINCDPISDVTQLEKMKNDLSNGLYKNAMSYDIAEVSEIVNGYKKRMRNEYH